jgi:hypothetical protein
MQTNSDLQRLILALSLLVVSLASDSGDAYSAPAAYSFANTKLGGPEVEPAVQDTFRGFAVLCDSVPKEWVEFGYYGYWGLAIHGDPGYYYPGAHAPGECEEPGHNGFKLTAFGRNLQHSDIPDPCYLPCQSLITASYMRAGPPVQYMVELNEIPGRKWIESVWVGSGSSCDPTEPGACYKAFFSLPEAVAEQYMKNPPEPDERDEGGGRYLIPQGNGPHCEGTRAQASSADLVGITCSGFEAGETLSINWDSFTDREPINVTATWNGLAATIVSIPPGIAGGANALSVNRVSNDVKVYVHVFVEPEMIVTGNQINLSGFDPGEPIALTWELGETGETQLGQLKADQSGSVSKTLNLPVLPQGTYRITAIGLHSNLIASGTYVVRLEVLLATTHGIPGDSIELSIRGLSSSERFTVWWGTAQEPYAQELANFSTFVDGRGWPRGFVTVPKVESGVWLITIEASSASVSLIFTVDILPTPIATPT